MQKQIQDFAKEVAAAAVNNTSGVAAPHAPSFPPSPHHIKVGQLHCRSSNRGLFVCVCVCHIANKKTLCQKNSIIKLAQSSIWNCLCQGCLTSGSSTKCNLQSHLIWSTEILTGPEIWHWESGSH